MKQFWLIFIAVLLAVFGISYYLASRAPRVTQAAPVLPNVTVQKIDAKAVPAQAATLLVKDPADQALIKKLLAENARYKIKDDVLAVSTGALVSTGTLAPVAAEAAPADPTRFEYSDYRLTVKNDGGTNLTYSLHQQFIALHTSGRDRTGSRVSNIKLYEVGPGEARTEVPLTTSEVVVDETVQHVLFGFNVQAGVVAAPGHGTGYVVGLQWLKRGRTDNPKDLTLAFLTPVGFFAPNEHQLGLLPLSVNVANLVPHQPLTNLWLSPYLGFAPGSTLSAGTINRVGVALTATF